MLQGANGIKICSASAVNDAMSFCETVVLKLQTE